MNKHVLPVLINNDSTEVPHSTFVSNDCLGGPPGALRVLEGPGGPWKTLEGPGNYVRKASSNVLTLLLEWFPLAFLPFWLPGILQEWFPKWGLLSLGPHMSVFLRTVDSLCIQLATVECL